MCDVSECSNFILVYVAVQFSQQHLLKTVFSSLYILASFVEINRKCMGLFLCFLSCSIDL